MLISLFLLAACAPAEIRTVALPSKSPLVTFRLVFTTGSASDPAGKPAMGLSIETAYAKVAKGVYWSADKAAQASQDPSAAFSFSETAAAGTKKLAFSEVTA